MQKIRTIKTLPLDGGVLCFHFINTVHSWRGINVHEYLPAYGEVIKWCKKVGILDDVRRASLLKKAELNPLLAGKALQQLKGTRELLYHFFSAIASHATKSMSPGLLAGFNTALSSSFSHLDFKLKHKKMEPGWKNEKNDLLEPLWVVIKSAYDILTLEDPSRIKECSKCGWIFMDRTKNNKRRWCNPALCGSIEKSKRYYQKIKKTKLDNPLGE